MLHLSQTLLNIKTRVNNSLKNDKFASESTSQEVIHKTSGILQKRKWESGMTIDRSSWGYRREASLNSILTIEEMIGRVISAVR